MPTAIGFNVETVTYKNLKFQVWDLGGQTSIRPYWRCYYSNTDAIIYVVDSADKERMGISKQELVSMLEVMPGRTGACANKWHFLRAGRMAVKRQPVLATSTRFWRQHRCPSPLFFWVGGWVILHLLPSLLGVRPARVQEEELKKAVLLVFANKQDLPGACTETEVSKLLGLSALKNRTWTIFKTSAKKGEGLTEAMDWYAHAVRRVCVARGLPSARVLLALGLPAFAVVGYGRFEAPSSDGFQPLFSHPHGCVLFIGL